MNETGIKTLHVTNDGEVPITFEWSCPKPFTLAPKTGSIPPGGSSTITARFSPTDASVYVAECVCSVPSHKSHTMRVGGIGKYPFLAASAERLQFGGVLSGQRATSHFKLCNTSLVYGRFKIVRTISDVEPVFTFSPSSGIVPPDGEQTIRVLYAPKVTGTFTNDLYEIRTPGGNAITIACEGEALGPEVQVSKEVINFGDLPITIPKKHVGRVLELFNRAPPPLKPLTLPPPLETLTLPPPLTETPDADATASETLMPMPSPLKPLTPMRLPAPRPTPRRTSPRSAASRSAVPPSSARSAAAPPFKRTLGSRPRHPCRSHPRVPNPHPT